MLQELGLVPKICVQSVYSAALHLSSHRKTRIPCPTRNPGCLRGVHVLGGSSVKKSVKKLNHIPYVPASPSILKVCMHLSRRERAFWNHCRFFLEVHQFKLCHLLRRLTASQLLAAILLQTRLKPFKKLPLPAVLLLCWEESLLCGWTSFQKPRQDETTVGKVVDVDFVLVTLLLSLLLLCVSFIMFMY